MGGNISLGKKTCDIPSNLPHGQEITLDFLQKYWSKDITSLKVEQLMVVTRVVDGEGIEKADDPEGDEFATADASAGGDEPADRAKRESVELSKRLGLLLASSKKKA